MVENNYLLLNKYKALATFIWTQEEGVVQESVVGGEGACQILKDKVLCVLQTGNAEDNFRANAYFEF
ncbi:hypothetical protein NON20_25655 (plasmid) [Synechocystis sp. B12]|nr:hypothetical protein NON20_25655 [Synechocystis sp. B12]